MDAGLAQRVHRSLALATKAEGADYHRIATLFAAERILARVSTIAPGATILKGGFLVRQLIPGDARRTTRDLDLELLGAHTTESVHALFTAVAQAPATDGVLLQPASLRVTRITGQVEPGHAVTIKGQVGFTPVTIPIDIGVGDALIPQPQSTKIRTLAPAIASDLMISAYHPATIVAEKFHGSALGGVVNRRMRDVLDIALLSEVGPYDGEAVSAALFATFFARKTDLPSDVPPAYRSHAITTEQQKTWMGFMRNNVPLSQHDRTLAQTLDTAWEFLAEPVAHARAAQPFQATWDPRGKAWIPGRSATDHGQGE